jgi:uncharacterized membrane protein HdeD (DUF308 family)
VRASNTFGTAEGIDPTAAGTAAAIGGHAMMMSSYESTRDATVLSWFLIAVGALTLAVGVFFVASPDETLKVFTVIGGILLLIDGVLAIIGALVGVSESRGLLAMVGVLSVIAGLVLIKKPFQTLVVFVVILGIWFVVAGIARFVSAFSRREARGTYIFVAIVDVIAGIVILSWPELSLSTLAVIFGIVLIIRGVLFAYAGWLVRKLGRDGGDASTTPAIP